MTLLWERGKAVRGGFSRGARQSWPPVGFTPPKIYSRGRMYPPKHDSAARHRGSFRGSVGQGRGKDIWAIPSGCHQKCDTEWEAGQGRRDFPAPGRSLESHRRDTREEKSCCDCQIPDRFAASRRIRRAIAQRIGGVSITEDAQSVHDRGHCRNSSASGSGRLGDRGMGTEAAEFGK